MKAIPRALTASLAAFALALALAGGISTRAAASPQATPVPSPVPAPMATAPSPGTDMLNNNPNGNWLQKFNRQATPDPGMGSSGSTKPTMTLPANHPAVPARCRALMKAYANKAITPAQHAKLKAQCMGKKAM